jgi:hypothetical protein
MFFIPILCIIFSISLFLNTECVAYETQYANTVNFSSSKTRIKVTLNTGCPGEKKENPSRELLNFSSSEECYEGCDEIRRITFSGEKGKKFSVKIYRKSNDESNEEIEFCTVLPDFSGKLELISGKIFGLYVNDGFFIEVNVNDELVFKHQIFGVGCM